MLKKKNCCWGTVINILAWHGVHQEAKVIQWDLMIADTVFQAIHSAFILLWYWQQVAAINLCLPLRISIQQNAWVLLLGFGTFCGGRCLLQRCYNTGVCTRILKHFQMGSIYSTGFYSEKQITLVQTSGLLLGMLWLVAVFRDNQLHLYGGNGSIVLKLFGNNIHTSMFWSWSLSYWV